MEEEYLNLTKRNMAELESDWLARISAVNERLNEAEDLDAYRAVVNEYLDELNTPDHWNSISLSLRRYLYQTFTGNDARTNPKAYTVNHDGRTYKFSSIDDSQTPDDIELDNYADLLYRLTLSNRCFAVSKRSGQVDETRGAISRADYLQYLKMEKNITRKRLFVLSMALKFDTSAMEIFSNALGESPVYNFRDVDECIYNFCHQCTGYKSMEAVRMLKSAYEAACTAEDLPEEREEAERMTAMIKADLARLAGNEYSDEEQLKDAFLQYLVDRRASFTGYSKTAQAALQKELDSEYVVDFSYSSVVSDCNVVGVRLRRYVYTTESRNLETNVLITNNAIGNEMYAVLIGIGLEDDEDSEDWTSEDQPEVNIRYIRMDERIKGGLLNGQRLSDLLPAENRQSKQRTSQKIKKHVTKKDILTLRFYKLAMSIDFSDLSEREHLDILQEFTVSTNLVLSNAGLSEIYVGNPFDHLILTALLSSDPSTFFPMVFRAASATNQD